MPSLALALHDGDVRLDALPDGTARIAGCDSLRRWHAATSTVRSAGAATTRRSSSTSRGDKVLAADTRDLRAVIAPNVAVRYAAEQPLEVTGTVTVPEARIALEGLDGGVSRRRMWSCWIRWIPKRTVASPLSLDLTLVLRRRRVALNGFGLDGTLTGQLRVRQRPGREMIGNGTLEVAGTYKAYGQKLTVSRGELIWSNAPIVDPLLDMRAERVVGDVTAGIQVRGHATSPQASVWADPAMDRIRSALLSRARPSASAAQATTKAGNSMRPLPRCPRAVGCLRRNSRRAWASTMRA